MANCMIRGAPSTVSLHAVRPISSHKILPPRSISYAMCSSGDRHLYTDAKKKLIDEKILKALKFEIKSEEQRLIKHVIPVPPPDFPFTIEDDPWDCYNMTLMKRNFNGEKIEVLLEYFHEDYYEDYYEGIDIDDLPAPSVEGAVKISKQSGRTLTVDFTAATDDLDISLFCIYCAKQIFA